MLWVLGVGVSNFFLFRYIVHLMSRRIEYTLPMEGEWMKAWCPHAEIQSAFIRKRVLYHSF